MEDELWRIRTQPELGAQFLHFDEQMDESTVHEDVADEDDHDINAISGLIAALGGVNKEKTLTLASDQVLPPKALKATAHHQSCLLSISN